MHVCTWGSQTVVQVIYESTVPATSEIIGVCCWCRSSRWKCQTTGVVWIFEIKTMGELVTGGASCWRSCVCSYVYTYTCGLMYVLWDDMCQMLEWMGGCCLGGLNVHMPTADETGIITELSECLTPAAGRIGIANFQIHIMYFPPTDFILISQKRNWLHFCVFWLCLSVCSHAQLHH